MSEPEPIMTERKSPIHSDATADLYDCLARVRIERRKAVLATVVEVVGSAPQVAGAKLLLLDDGRAVGTVGGGTFERCVLERAAELLASESGPRTELWTANLTRDLGMCCGGEMRVFFERILGSERLVIFGAGHVGRALCSVAAAAGFAVTVVDEREALAIPERFPGAQEVICEDPEVVLPELVYDPATYCVVVTHDHPLDEKIVKALCSRPVRFLGLVGSRAKRNKFLMRLRAQGVTEEALARLRSPVGFDIGAVTPEEIAVSITAELVAIRRGLQTGGDLATAEEGRLLRPRALPTEER
jgi:xanthine dehydrogenase accessory factor